MSGTLREGPPEFWDPVWTSVCQPLAWQAGAAALGRLPRSHLFLEQIKAAGGVRALFSQGRVGV